MAPKLPPQCYSSDWVMDPMLHYFSLPPGEKSKIALKICKEQVKYLLKCSELETEMYREIYKILDSFNEEAV